MNGRVSAAFLVFLGFAGALFASVRDRDAYSGNQASKGGQVRNFQGQLRLSF